MTGEHGPNLFYPESATALTLLRGAQGPAAAAQAATSSKAWASRSAPRAVGHARGGARRQEEIDGRIQIAPLADWNRAAGRALHARTTTCRVHPLYARGYTSIGCGPCTRAVAPAKTSAPAVGGGSRTADKECGIHFAPTAASVDGARSVIDMHKGFMLWFTGLSGAGKSTISRAAGGAAARAGCEGRSARRRRSPRRICRRVWDSARKIAT